MLPNRDFPEDRCEAIANFPGDITTSTWAARSYTSVFSHPNYHVDEVQRREFAPEIKLSLERVVDMVCRLKADLTF